MCSRPTAAQLTPASYAPVPASQGRNGPSASVFDQAGSGSAHRCRLARVGRTHDELLARNSALLEAAHVACLAHGAVQLRLLATLSASLAACAAVELRRLPSVRARRIMARCGVTLALPGARIEPTRRVPPALAAARQREDADVA